MELNGDREPSGAGRGGSPPSAEVASARVGTATRRISGTTAHLGTANSRPPGHACHARRPDRGTVRDVWSLHCRAEPLTGLAAVALAAATLSGCGSGDSTVAKTPQPTSATASMSAPPAASPAPVAAPPSSTPAPADPCAVNLASPTIAKAVSDLPRDPRSQQPWSPEPLAGNYNECAQLSAVIIKANTNAGNPTTRAVMFHLGQFIPQGVPDTYGFNGIDAVADHRRHGGLDLPRRHRLDHLGEVPLERHRL